MTWISQQSIFFSFEKAICTCIISFLIPQRSWILTLKLNSEFFSKKSNRFFFFFFNPDFLHWRWLCYIIIWISRSTWKEKKVFATKCTSVRGFLCSVNVIIFTKSVLKNTHISATLKLCLCFCHSPSVALHSLPPHSPLSIIILPDSEKPQTQED